MHTELKAKEAVRTQPQLAHANAGQQAHKIDAAWLDAGRATKHVRHMKLEKPT